MTVKKVLLVVDDDAMIRDIIKSSLIHDYFILEASTYLDVMRFPSQSVDLAIIDYLLPDRDGFEVMTSLRVGNPGLPVIIMTGYGNEDVIIRALRKHVVDYMKKPLNLRYLRQRVSEILGDEQGREDHALPSHNDNNLVSIAKHIQDNYMEELTLDKLSRLACMSRFSFCRAFKERFNQCFTSYVNSVRLKNAGELLKNSHDSITEIAFSVGYRNSGHFNRVFKQAYKMSPRAYRRKMISNSDQNVF
jgi:YesN/AraC family two-component response regulator